MENSYCPFSISMVCAKAVRSMPFNLFSLCLRDPCLRLTWNTCSLPSTASQVLQDPAPASLLNPPALSSATRASTPGRSCLGAFECVSPLPGEVSLVPHMAEPSLPSDLSSDTSDRLSDVWFPVQDVNPWTFHSHLFSQEKIFTNENPQLFLDPAEN